LLKSLKNKLCQRTTTVLEDTPLKRFTFSNKANWKAMAPVQLPASACFLPDSHSPKKLLLDQPAANSYYPLRVSPGLFLPLNSGNSSPKPEIVWFSRQLAQLSQLTSAFTYEQERQLPLSGNKAQRGVGTSRYAVRLRQQIRKPLLTASQSNFRGRG